MRYDGFFDINQMRAYLRRCVIRVDELPAFINEVEETYNRAGNKVYKLVYERLEGLRNKKRVNIKSRKVNLLPVPLGYCNYTDKGTVLYCMVASRIPSRMWKIGLNQNNLLLKPVAGKKSVPIENNAFIQSQSLGRTIMGDFPSYYKCIQQVREWGPYYTVAFHRHFAIQYREKRLALLYYKFKVPVGYAEDGGTQLKPQYSFLQEHLNEV